MKETIKSEKEIIKDAFFHRQSFIVRQLDGINHIVFKDDNSLRRKWKLINY